MRPVDVLVIGAGQAGLSAAYHLQHRGFKPVTRASKGDLTFVVLDAENGPGGAWRHRWESLKMSTINGIYELPGYPMPQASPDAASRDVLPAYFADYEAHFDFDVQRPINVTAVERQTLDSAQQHQIGGFAADDDSRADGFIVRSAEQSWAARYVINATGTWRKPFWPHYPGQQTFLGRQLHTHDYVSANEFIGQRVVIVGAGISATQLLEEISRVTDTLWVTRTEPDWRTPFTEKEILASLADVEERTRLGLPPQSVVRVTGMQRSPWVEQADARGVLVRHPMFERIEPQGVRMADGRFEPADVILWATGFRAEVAHLAPLGLRTPEGGIKVWQGRSLDEPKLFIIGYGASQSTVGANRAGRDAVRAILREITPPVQR